MGARFDTAQKTSRRRRPIASAALLALVALVAWLAVAPSGHSQTPSDPAQSTEGDGRGTAGQALRERAEDALSERGVSVGDGTVSADRDDMQFLAGRTVTVTQDVSDDLVAAGRTVTIQGARVGTAIIAGYQILLDGGVASDMIAAASELNIDGQVDDDLLAAARHLKIASNAVVAGDVRAAAETLEINGHVGGSLRAAARRVILNGDIIGKVDLAAQEIVIGETAHIHADITYRSPEPPKIAEGATLDGELLRKEFDLPNLRKAGFALIGLGVVLAVSWLGSVLVMLIAFQLAFPAYAVKAARRAVERPLASLGLGIAFGAIGLILALIATVSVLGLPAGLALFTLLALIQLIALGTTGLGAGLLLRRGLRGSGHPRVASQIGWLVAGLFLLVVIALIPYVGGLILILAQIAGTGGAVTELWARLRASSSRGPTSLP
ncbi:polymer-forming cytoskeletal protein [Amorphus sp. 3PC139-8]|uniref:bactofilin family protein n=1 Tax=Amorphus sp. 3PC139-8 TaxID=2735676 RepID=UPI00345D09C0